MNAFADPTGKAKAGIAADFDGTLGRLQLYDVQMSSLFVSESHALQALAPLAGQPAGVVAQLARQSADVTALMQSVLWDANTKIYRQVDASPKRRGFSAAISPTSFYPMIAGVATVPQAEAMVTGHLTNASEFCVDPGTDFADPARPSCPFAVRPPAAPAQRANSPTISLSCRPFRAATPTSTTTATGEAGLGGP